jgi:hypothetical protein
LELSENIKNIRLENIVSLVGPAICNVIDEKFHVIDPNIFKFPSQLGSYIDIP